MPWAKLHTDILGDPKLMRAARKGAKGLHLLPWFIAFAKEADDRGRLTIAGEAADAVDIAALIPGTAVKLVAEALESLERIGVLVADGDGAVRLAAWDLRSGTKPSDGKEAIHDRVTAFRDRKRAATRNAHTNGSGNAASETPSNALQPPRSNATEERRGEERRRESEADERVTPFAAAWAAYPKRSGGNSAHDAERAWNARLKSGVAPSAMFDGTLRYRRYCEATGKLGTEFVMQGARFYGASMPFEEPWDTPGDADPMPAMYAPDGVEYSPEWLAWNDRQGVPAP